MLITIALAITLAILLIIINNDNTLEIMSKNKDNYNGQSC